MESLSKTSLANSRLRASWTEAWHGCKIESVYSILYHGRLEESCNIARGDRFFSDAPGVYLHHDQTAHKSENYTRFIDLFLEGTFWSSKWEVVADRQDKVPAKHKDQWVQRARSIHLVALWVCGRTAANMENGSEVQPYWDPFCEANPLHFGAGC